MLPEDRLLITLSDVLQICRKAKKTILLSILATASLAVLYTLTRPVEYRAEATFREKAKTNETAKSSSLAMFIGIPELNENAAISLFKSHKLIERAVLKRDLQAKIVPVGFNIQILQNIRKNLIAEYAHLVDAETPFLPDLVESVKARQVQFSQETPLKLRIAFSDEEHFVITGDGGKKLGEGALGVPFEGPQFSFILTKTDALPLKKRQFKLTLKPLEMVADELNDRITVEPDNLDKGLLKLSFAHRNRHEAYLFLNALMVVYQDYLREEHQRITGDQVAYLHKRQSETASKLQGVMREHAQALSENMATIEFLFHNQQSFSQKLMLIDFELNRLEKALNEGLANYDKLGVETGDPTIINQMLAEIRRHKQHIDTIEMALTNAPQQDQKARKKAFSEQLNALDIIRKNAGEAQSLLTSLDKGEKLPTKSSLFKNPKYLLQEWQGKVTAAEQALKKAPDSEKEAQKHCLETCRENFKVYLGNLIRLLGLEERLLQERLAHSQSPLSEFQGINLTTATQIYVNYGKVLNDIEADMLHYQFIIDQMQDPSFEPSSLSSVLEDPVSREIINRASNIVLTMKDQDNHSPRELERLKNDLAQQKEFLKIHARQTLQLLTLRQKLYQEKLVALQTATRELLQQEIALIEKNLADYLSNRIQNLKQEKLAIEHQQISLRKTMQKMPEKWAAEKLVDQQLETNRKMIEEIAKIVESKNIALNIDLSQSAPIDHATLQLNPQNRKLPLFLIVGAFFGAFASVGFVLAKAVATGLPATKDNLTHLGQHVAGSLSPQAFDPASLSDSDLDALRRAEAHLCQKNHQTLLLMINKGPDFSASFAELLSKSGKRIILLPISFDHATNEQPGLLQYLEGQAEKPKIITSPVCDRISSGGISRFSIELLYSRKFQELKEKLSQEYDYVIAISNCSPITGEAEKLFTRFDHALINVHEERLNDLRPFFHHAHEKRVTFIV